MATVSRFIAIGLLLACFTTTRAAAQSSAQSALSSSANAWMLTPTPFLAWHKSVAESIRKQRDMWWDEGSSRSAPLIASSQIAQGGSQSSFSAHDPEIPDRPNRAIVAATFTEHSAVLS